MRFLIRDLDDADRGTCYVCVRDETWWGWTDRGWGWTGRERATNFTASEAMTQLAEVTSTSVFPVNLVLEVLELDP